MQQHPPALVVGVGALREVPPRTRLERIADRLAPPDALSPNAKTHNYLNLIMGDLEVKARDAEAWAVTLDVNGNLCEGMGSNIFIVRDGALITPLTKYVLPGISRQTVIGGL